MSLLLPLTTKITNKSKKSTKNRVLSASFGNGYSQIADDGLNSTIDSWIIVYSPLKDPDLTTLKNFYSTVGVTQYFRWTPIGETVEKKWRIVPDSWKESMIDTTQLLISFKIVQVFDLGI